MEGGKFRFRGNQFEQKKAGCVKTRSPLILEGDVFLNKGKVVSEGSLKLIGFTKSTNDGMLSSVKKLEGQRLFDFKNNGEMKSSSWLALEAQDGSNKGTITALEVRLLGGRLVNEVDGILKATKTFHGEKTILTNYGILGSLDQIKFLSCILNNEIGGDIFAERKIRFSLEGGYNKGNLHAPFISFQGGHFTNASSGIIQALKEARVQDTFFVNRHQIKAATIQLIKGELKNEATGVVQADELLESEGAVILNEGAVSSLKKMVIRGGQLYNTSDSKKVEEGKDLEGEGPKIRVIAPEVLFENCEISNFEGGLIQGTQSLSFLKSDLFNDGEIASKNGIHLMDSIFTQGSDGKIFSESKVTFKDSAGGENNGEIFAPVIKFKKGIYKNALGGVIQGTQCLNFVDSQILNEELLSSDKNILFSGCIFNQGVTGKTLSRDQMVFSFLKGGKNHGIIRSPVILFEKGSYHNGPKGMIQVSKYLDTRGTHFLNDGTLKSLKKITFEDSTIENASLEEESQSSLKLTEDEEKGQGQILSPEIEFQGGSFKNGRKGTVKTDKTFKSQDTKAVNLGKIVSLDEMLLRGGDFTNETDGRVFTKNTLMVDTDVFTNRGEFFGEGKQIFNPKKGVNENLLEGGLIEVSNTFVNEKLINGQLVKMLGGQWTNKGLLRSLERLEVFLPTLKDIGKIESDKGLYLKLDESFIYTGQKLPSFKGMLELDMGKHTFHNKAKFLLNGGFKLIAGHLINENEINCTGDIDFDIKDLVENGIETAPEIIARNTLKKAWWSSNGFYQLVRNFVPFGSGFKYINNDNGGSFSIYGPHTQFMKASAKIISGGNIKINCDNFHNKKGQVGAVKEIEIQAKSNIQNGSWLYKEVAVCPDACWLYCPWFSSNGSLIASGGKMFLKAGIGIANDHGDMVSFDRAHFESGKLISNIAGYMHSGEDAYVKTSALVNQRQECVNLRTSMCYDGDGCRHHQRTFETSKAAILQSFGLLTLDVGYCDNYASYVYGAKGVNPIKTAVSNRSMNLWNARQIPRWHFTGAIIHTILPATLSSPDSIDMSDIKGFINSGVVSAPVIDINAEGDIKIGWFQNMNIPAAGGVPTHFSLGGVLQDPFFTAGLFQESADPASGYKIEPILQLGGPSEALPPMTLISRHPQFQPLPHPASSPFFKAMLHPLAEVMAFQSALHNAFKRGYVVSHLSPGEHIQQFRENAHALALKNQTHKALPVFGPHPALKESPQIVVLDEEEAQKTEKPLWVYRLKKIEGDVVAVPEYFGPPDAVSPLLQGHEGVVYADEKAKIATQAHFHHRGTIYGEKKISVNANTITVEKLVYEQEKTLTTKNIWGAEKSRTEIIRTPQVGANILSNGPIKMISQQGQSYTGATVLGKSFEIINKKSGAITTNPTTGSQLIDLDPGSYGKMIGKSNHAVKPYYVPSRFGAVDGEGKIINEAGGVSLTATKAQAKRNLLIQGQTGVKIFDATTKYVAKNRGYFTDDGLAREYAEGVVSERSLAMSQLENVIIIAPQGPTHIQGTDLYSGKSIMITGEKNTLTGSSTPVDSYASFIGKSGSDFAFSETNVIQTFLNPTVVTATDDFIVTATKEDNILEGVQGQIGKKLRLEAARNNIVKELEQRTYISNDELTVGVSFFGSKVFGKLSENSRFNCFTDPNIFMTPKTPTGILADREKGKGSLFWPVRLRTLPEIIKDEKQRQRLIHDAREVRDGLRAGDEKPKSSPITVHDVTREDPLASSFDRTLQARNTGDRVGEGVYTLVESYKALDQFSSSKESFWTTLGNRWGISDQQGSFKPRFTINLQASGCEDYIIGLLSSHLKTYDFELVSGHDSQLLGGTQVHVENNAAIDIGNDLLLEKGTLTHHHENDNAGGHIGFGGGSYISFGLNQGAQGGYSSHVKPTVLTVGNNLTGKVQSNAQLKGGQVQAGAIPQLKIQKQLYVETHQDQAQESGYAWEFSTGGSGSMSMNHSYRRWSDALSYLKTDGPFNVEVLGGTSVKGGLISSASNQLNLMTPWIKVEDLQDVEKGKSLATGASGMSPLSGYKTVPQAGIRLIADLRYEEKNKRGVTRGVVGLDSTPQQIILKMITAPIASWCRSPAPSAWTPWRKSLIGFAKTFCKNFKLRAFLRRKRSNKSKL